MSAHSRNEITDPNLDDLPAEAFEPVDPDRGLTEPQLELRIRAKREAAAQDAGHIAPPGPDEPVEQQEEEPEVDEEQPVEETEEEADEEQPEGDEEPEADEEQVEGEADEDEFYLGRYRDREAAEEGLAEKDRIIADLFRKQHEREQAAAQQDQGAATLDVPAWHDWAEQQVENEAGVQGALAALNTGGPQGFDIYMAHWMGVDDPQARAEAVAFNSEVQRQFAAQSALAAVQTDTNHRAAADDEPVKARENVARRYKDFDDLSSDMDRLASPDDQTIPKETKAWLTDMATNGGVEGKERVWDYLYMAASAARQPKRRAAKTEEMKRRRASADADKLAATVSSAEGSATSTPLSEAELAVLRKKNGIREKLGQPPLPEQ